MIAPTHGLRPQVLSQLLVAVVLILLPLGGASGQAPTSPGAAEGTQQDKMKRATQLFQQGNDREAERLFLEIVAQDPKQVAAYNFLGILYSRTGRHEQSIAAFQKLLAVNPDYAGAYFGLGVAYKFLKDPQRALENFRKAVALYPPYTVAWLNIAVITDALGQVEESVQAYHRVLDTAEPSSDEYKQARARLDDISEDPDVAKKVRDLMTRAAALLQKNERAAAVPLLQEAAILLPKSLTVRKMLADETARIGDYDASVAARRELVQIAPGDLALRFDLAAYLGLLGQVDDAIVAYRELLSAAVNRDDKMPEVERAKTELFRLLDQKAIQDYLSKADVLTLEGKWDQAIAELRLAQNVDPDSTLVQYNLLLLAQRGGYRDLALSTGRELLLMEPDSRDVYLLMGQAYQDQHFFFKAIESYVRVLSLSSGQQREDLPYSEAQVGIENAIVALKKSAPQAINNFGKSLRAKAKGQMSEAESYLKLGVAVAPEAPLMHVHLGKLYVESDKTDQAIEEYRKAVEFNSGLYTTWLDLSALYVKKGWYRTAGEIFETLLRLPDSDIKQIGTSREDLTRRAAETRESWTKAHEQALALFQEGQTSFQAGNLKDAISKFLEAHYQEPDNAFILNSLGVAQAANLDGKRAAQAFQDALAIDPHFVAVKFQLGLVLEANKFYAAAKSEYRQLLAMPEAKGRPEYGQAQERLKAANELYHRLHDAELHEDEGLPVVEKKEPPSQEELTVGLWHLKQAVSLDPDPGRYYYNLGLMYEKIASRRIQTEQIAIVTQEQNLELHQDAIAAYRGGTEREPTYLAPYLRLGQIYQVAGKPDDALAVYEQALSQKPVAPSEGGVKSQIQQRVDDLKQRFFASAGFQVGFDNNFSASDPASEDQFNSLNVDLSYLLVKRPTLQLSLGYQLQTSYYIRSQIFFSSSGFSAGLQHTFSPRVTGSLRARSQLSFVKDDGLTSALSEETLSFSYFGRSFPTVGTLQYSFLGISYADPNSSQNTLQHQGSLTVSQQILSKYTVDGGYVFTLQHRTASPDNEYQGHQVNLRVQWPLKGDLSVNTSVSESLQLFLNPDTREGSKRRNTMLSYGVGLVKRLTGFTALSADLQVQRNDSNLGTAAPADALDILLNRSPSLGSYQKRVVSVAINHSF